MPELERQSHESRFAGGEGGVLSCEIITPPFPPLYDLVIKRSWFGSTPDLPLRGGW